MGDKNQVLSSPLLVPPPSEFTFDYNTSTSNAQRWTAWLRRFERYLRSTQITEEEKKIDLLLYVAGPAVEEVYLARADKNHKYEEIVKVLDDYFLPSMN